MGSTFCSLHHHLVFSTKERRPLINPAWRGRLHEYLGGTLRGLGGVPERVGGVADHVHILFSLGTTAAPAEVVRELKKASSSWATQNHDRLFGWQEGYGIFSVSATHCQSIERYIARQEEHHRQRSFVEELRRLLRRNGIAFDPRFFS